MSDTPIADKIIDDLDPMGPPVHERIQELERHLRFLRNRANNYVPADDLKEIDKFLKP